MTMKWMPYAVLFTLAAVSGSVCYWLFGQQRMEEVAGVAGMATLTMWFILTDIRIDQAFARDAKRAEKERQDWDSYST